MSVYLFENYKNEVAKRYEKELINFVTSQLITNEFNEFITDRTAKMEILMQIKSSILNNWCSAITDQFYTQLGKVIKSFNHYDSVNLFITPYMHRRVSRSDILTRAEAQQFEQRYPYRKKFSKVKLAKCDYVICTDGVSREYLLASELASSINQLDDNYLGEIFFKKFSNRIENISSDEKLIFYSSYIDEELQKLPIAFVNQLSDCIVNYHLQCSARFDELLKIINQ